MNAGLIARDSADAGKTQVQRLASEKIGPDLYRQVHRIVYTTRPAGRIEVITVNEASSEECSMSGVSVFVVSQRLGEP
jgi:hypothetical protein